MQATLDAFNPDTFDPRTIPERIAAAIGFPMQVHRSEDGKVWHSGRDWVSGITPAKQPHSVLSNAMKRLNDDPLTAVQLVHVANTLDYLAADGKTRKSLFFTDEGLYILTTALNIESAYRRRILNFMSKVTSIHTNLERNPILALEHYQRRSVRYMMAVQGMTQEEAIAHLGVRIDSMNIRNSVTAAIGIYATHVPGTGYGGFTNKEYQTLFDDKAPQLKQRLGIGPKDDLRSAMKPDALQLCMALESSVARILKANGETTYGELITMTGELGEIYRVGADHIEAKTGQDVVTGRPLLANT